VQQTQRLNKLSAVKEVLVGWWNISSRKKHILECLKCLSN